MRMNLKKLIKSKFFIITLTVAVVLTVFPAVLAAMGRTDLLRSGVHAVAAPFRTVAVSAGRALNGFTEYFTAFDRLKEENEKLRAQLAEMEGSLAAAEAAKAENEWLRSFLLYSAENPEMKKIMAATVARESGDYVTVFTVNRGTRDGVARGMPVVSSQGLVGYVCEVGRSYAKVRTLVSQQTAVGAYCARSGAYGLLEGNYGALSGGLCRLTLAESTADIQEGDVIVTSGVGSVYPFGLSIGTVRRVKRNTHNRTLVAEVEPFEPLTSVRNVLILDPWGSADAS